MPHSFFGNQSLPGGDPKNIEVDGCKFACTGVGSSASPYWVSIIHIGRWLVVVYGTINLLLNSGSYIHTAWMQFFGLWRHHGICKEFGATTDRFAYWPVGQFLLQQKTAFPLNLFRKRNFVTTGALLGGQNNESAPSGNNHSFHSHAHLTFFYFVCQPTQQWNVKTWFAVIPSMPLR